MRTDHRLPIWFGVIIGWHDRPPLGLNVFVIWRMVKDVPAQDIHRGVLRLLVVMVVLLGILMLSPDIALFLHGR